MYRFEISIVCLIVFLFAYLSYAGETSLPNPYVISYPFKSAIIHNDIKNEYGHGKIHEGKELVYIKGSKLAKVTKMPVPDPKGKIKNVEILRIFTPDYVYEVDLIEKAGTKIDNPKKFTQPAYDKLSVEDKKAFHKRMDRRGIASLDLLGLGKEVGTDTILGRKCDVYESGEELEPKELSEERLMSRKDSYYMKSWIWEDAALPLKIIITGLGWSNELISTKVEENVRIPENIFMVPSDIKITYDKEKSEFAKREALSRFELYKTGKPLVVKMKLKREEIKPKGDSKASESNKNLIKTTDR
jgi:hypothetical protein